MQFTQSLAPLRLNNIRQTPNSLQYLAKDDDIHSGEYNDVNVQSCRGRCKRKIVEDVHKIVEDVKKANVSIPVMQG